MRTNNLRSFLIMIVASFLGAVFTYGNYIYRSTLNIDGEFTNNFYQTVSLGRWFHAFLRNYFLPEPFLPVLTPLISVILICIAAMVFCKIFRLSPFHSAFALLLFITSPQLAYQLEFLNQSDTFSLGVLMCTISALILVSRSGYLGFIAASILIALSLGIYQTLISYLAVVIVAYYTIMLARDEINLRDLIKGIAKGASSALISLILYAVISLIVKKHFNVNADGYLSSYMSFSDGGFHYFLTVVNGFLRAIVGLQFYGGTTLVILLIATLYCVFSYAKSKDGKYITIALLSLIVIFITFSFIVISGSSSPPRLFVACGAAMSFSYILVLTYQEKNNTLSAIAALVICTNIFFVNKLFSYDVEVRENDVLMAKEIKQRIGEIGKACDGAKIYIHGGYDKNNTMNLRSDTFGKSFFWWDGGNYLRAVAFLNHYKICNAEPANEQEVKSLLSDIMVKPNWPRDGSVYSENGVIVIKLSDEKGWLPFLP
ncbi:TPA: glucosyltransferase domain-containing protein [Serratia marcescens]|uniref:Glucosyltransferase domain-containing protein n=4 Tax=Serratia TaxID=613 RepID=A0AAW6XCC7_9GAMM|nr:MULTISPECIES: glucosyltransferase domain-containing protein [Serratia]MBH2633854.1 glucosyltransferase domain-containing protein [Serratia marcescens]MDK4769225.1 glucosyltransferase domain-containing protein [Serratia nevei]MDK4771542.1 glucosyltransferase domain-containing protein [Serratia nevei]MDK4799157.1 glucosyltransferase domain-containing protein [Serratia nevei]MDK4861127.1 glucosyltransferase domain-containing protein [Serratia nevei]